MTKHYVITGRPARSADMPVLFLLIGPQMGFSPHGATRCRDKREIWHKFQVYRGKNVGIQPPKKSKFRILAGNLYLRGDSFAIFLRNSQRLYASIGSFEVFSLVTFEGQTPKL